MVCDDANCEEEQAPLSIYQKKRQAQEELGSNYVHMYLKNAWRLTFRVASVICAEI